MAVAIAGIERVRRRRGSVGLGLFIALEIVTAHGGTIHKASSNADRRNATTWA